MLYDGTCGLCNGVNRFVLRFDQRRVFDFASLQSETGRGVQQRFAKDPDALSTFYVVADYRSPSPILLAKANAALFVLRTLGWPWKVLTLIRVLPARLLDSLYDFLARHRYQLFGRAELCALPAPEHRPRFIDV